MHALVTGATGFIGTELCRELINRGFDLTCLLRASPTSGLANHISEKDVNVVNCDITNATDLIRVLRKVEKIDYVFHLAGQTHSKNDESPEKYFLNNFIGTLNMLECCRILCIKKLIFSSTIAVYGLSAGQHTPRYLPVDENHEAMPYNFYDLSKYYAEKLCEFYHSRFGIISVVLRYSRVYGPSMKKGLIYEATQRALSGESIEVRGDISTDFVFVRDVVKANLEAAQRISRYEIFNIGSGEEVTLHWICSKILALANSSATLKYHKEPRSKFALDVSKAKKLLEFLPMSTNQGLKECIEYTRNLTK